MNLPRKKSYLAATALSLLALILLLFRGAIFEHKNDRRANGQEVEIEGRKFQGTADRTRRSKFEIPRDGDINDLESSFSFFNDNGEVTSYALELAGLRHEDARKIKAIKKSAWDELTKLLVENSHYVPEESNPAEGVHVYRINSFPTAGDVVLEKMMNEFQVAFGKQAASILGSGFHTWRYFGNFGRYDINLRMEPNFNRFGSSGPTAYKFEMLDPRTGKIFGQASYFNSDEVKEYFGSSLDSLESHSTGKEFSDD